MRVQGKKPHFRHCEVSLSDPKTSAASPTEEVSVPEDSFAPPLAPMRARQFRHIQLRADAPIARMRLDRPEHNLLNEPTLREMTDGLEVLSERGDIKAIVLDATGKVFCGGMDVGEYTAERAFQVIDAFHSLCVAMMETRQPIIVVVNGPAIGGGAELVAFGDVVIATPRAKFALPEITIGMFPPLASTMFPYLVGPKLALELVLTGEAVTAERAHAIGLVNRLVPEAQLDQALNELLARVTAQSGAVLSMAKKAVVGGMGLSLRDALKFSMDVFLNELYRLEDSREGLQALIEKRKPNWKNR
jgi:cyclohexa-1,5-dienecarbonyl-CoA hydratase